MSLARIPSKTLSLRATASVPTSSQINDYSTGSDFEHTQAQAFSGVYSADLLRGQKAVEIQHNGSTYRLQATRLGKLILTK